MTSSGLSSEELQSVKSTCVEEPGYESIFFACQPILNQREEQVGYEMLYRETGNLNQAVCGDWDEATLKVAACGLICAEENNEHGRKAFVNFSPAAIVGKVPYAIPPANLVVEIRDQVNPPLDLVESLKALVADGYEICIDHLDGDYRNPFFPDLASWAKYDVLGKTGAQVGRDITRIRRGKPKVIALRVETRDSYLTLKTLGVEYFQGYYFKEPQVISGRKLTSHEASRLRIFREIERDEPDIDDLSRAISSDVALSYRLLRYLNSAIFGLRGKVDSIKQALLLLGLLHIRHWLRVVLLTDLLPKGKSRELSVMSVKRGKFFELLARQYPALGCKPDKMFLLGLFSMLEGMLDRPMREIAKELPIDSEHQAALCGEGGICGQWLDLVMSFERADWPELNRLITEMRLKTADVAKAYFEAGLWTTSIFEGI